MSLSYPIDILADWPGWTTEFDLLWRQEQSRQSNGVTRLKDFGEPLWRLKAVSRSLSRRDLDIWRARLDALDNGINTFKGYSLSRCFPIAYPNGSWPTGVSFDGVSAAVQSVGADNKSLALDSLPAGFVFSVGDMISINYDTDVYSLHRVMEAATADGTGLTPTFEVRPHLASGVGASDPVSVKRPFTLMTVVPGSISSAASESGRGSISFEAIEYR